MKNITLHNISLRPLCKAHLDALAPALRPADRAEMWATYRLGAREGLELCFMRSAQAVAFLYRGKVAAAAGVAPQSLLGDCACVWSWTSKEVENCPKAFWKASAVVLKHFRALYPRLYAVCDERYAEARRYLRRLGAREEGEAFYLKGGETRFRLYRF